MTTLVWVAITIMLIGLFAGTGVSIWRRHLDAAFGQLAMFFAIVGVSLSELGLYDLMIGGDPTWGYLPQETFQTPFIIAAGFAISSAIAFAYYAWRNHTAKVEYEKKEATRIGQIKMAVSSLPEPGHTLDSKI